jgi:sugar O-acyltransferase (sialic acid O-acetyltransferase NeuD family)
MILADKVIIIGAGGFSAEILQFITEIHGVGALNNVAGFLDDDPRKTEQQLLSGKIIGSITEHRVDPSAEYILAIGNPRNRKRIAERFHSSGARFASLIHPLATVSKHATLDAGCIISEFVKIGPYAQLGLHALLTEYVLVGHHSKIGDYCVLSPFSAVTGRAELQEGVFLGVHAAVTPGKCVGSFSSVAAGSIVYRNVPPNALAKGNPAVTRTFPNWERTPQQRRPQG